MYDDRGDRRRYSGLELEDGVMSDEHAICSNIGCHCPVVEEGTHCSDHCRGLFSGTVSGEGCDCEHSSCCIATNESSSHIPAMTML